MVEVERGDIIIANLEPVRGSEQGGIRPCLVLQNDIANKFSPTVIISAITSKKFSKQFPTNIELPKEDSGLEKDSVVMLNQLRTIDKSRICKKISSLDREIMDKVDLAIEVSLGLG